MTLTGFVRFTHPHVHISATFISKIKIKGYKTKGCIWPRPSGETQSLLLKQFSSVCLQIRSALRNILFVSLSSRFLRVKSMSRVRPNLEEWSLWRSAWKRCRSVLFCRGLCVLVVMSRISAASTASQISLRLRWWCVLSSYELLLAFSLFGELEEEEEEEEGVKFIPDRPGGSVAVFCPLKLFLHTGHVSCWKHTDKSM